MFRSRQKNDILFYMALVFLLFPILGIFWFGYPVWTIFPTIGFALVYLVVVHLKDDYQTLLMLLWIYLLGYIVYMALVIEGSMLWFFFYPSNLLVWPFGDSLKSYRAISFLTCLSIVVGRWLLFSNSFVSKMNAIVVAVFILTMTYSQHKIQVEEAMKSEIERQNAYINTLAAENERNRIGRDLHDTLGHTFALISLKSELAMKLLEQKNMDKVRQELDELHDISQKSMKDVRELINQLKYRTLSEEIETLSEMLDVSGVVVSVDNQILDEQLSPKVQSALTMILRELVTNVIKHAEASTCQIRLRKDDRIILHFSDDGRGFPKITGEELQSIKGRLIQMDGTIDIVSSKHPTMIKIEMEDKVL
ncbi:sensor histidine kinase [Streptococcus pluranimalium]|uniref:sensor histidine kinase n=1 Tax=Streptococcus pluranimalium TaxID=82348 RepID=UPI002A789D39|nr:sensor histidine kinase [Streptococcus pluranimalium]